MDRIQRLVPAPDGGDDRVRTGGPSEGLWMLLDLGAEAVDASLEFDKRSEEAATALRPSTTAAGGNQIAGIRVMVL